MPSAVQGLQANEADTLLVLFVTLANHVTASIVAQLEGPDRDCLVSTQGIGFLCFVLFSAPSRSYQAHPNQGYPEDLLFP